MADLPDFGTDDAKPELPDFGELDLPRVKLTPPTPSTGEASAVFGGVRKPVVLEPPPGKCGNFSARPIESSAARLDAQARRLADAYRPGDRTERLSGMESDPEATPAPIQAALSIPGKILEPISSAAGGALSEFLNRTGIDPFARPDKPLIQLPRRMNAEESAKSPITAGVVNTLHDTAEGFLTPENAVIMALMPKAEVWPRRRPSFLPASSLPHCPSRCRTRLPRSTIRTPLPRKR